METYFPFDETLKSTDGTQPTFTRDSTATNPDTGATAAANEPRFVEGRFGKAVLVEEGASNVVDLTSWDPVHDDAYETVTKTSDTLYGQPIYKGVKKSAGTPPIGLKTIDIPAGASYTATIWSRVDSAPAGWPPKLLFYRGSGLANATSAVVGRWERLTATYTNNTGSALTGVKVYFYLAQNAGETTYFACPQVEAQPYATSFVDGTRANEWLILPVADVLRADAGTIEGWILVNDQIAGHLGNAAFFTHANGTWPANSLYMARLSTGQFRVRFNTLVSNATPPVALVSGQWLHFAYRWNADAVSAFLDGQLLTEVSNTAPDISVGPELHIGGYTSGAERANTRFCGLRLHRRALSDEEIAAHAATIAPDRQLHTRLVVGRTDGATWVDLTDCLARATIELGDVTGLGTDGTGGDMPVRRMTMTLRNDGAPLSPHIQGSSWNQFGGKYAPLLWPMREVILDVATTAPGFAPSTGDWTRLFHGYLGDSVAVDGDAVTCECRDLAKRLQNTYVETVREYGSKAGVAAETVIQSILNDNLGAGVVTLCAPASPGFMLHPYRVEYQSVWDAIQQISAQIGWWLGYRWRAATQRFELTLMAPPRYKRAGNYVLTADDHIYTQPLDISDADIRNVASVTYKDRALGKRQTVTVSDAVSILEYGRRAMGIEERDASLIDTSAEAQALAQAAVDDLRDMTGTTRITMPLMPRLELFHGVIVQNPLVSDQDDFYGVDSVMHDLDFEAGRFRTEVIASRRVVGARTRWLQMQTRPGGTVPITGGDVIGGQATATLVVAAADSSWRGRESADYICDGVSDQVQINDALDWLVSDGRTGGKVMLLEGTYVIDDDILMPSHTQIEGQGPGTVIKLKDGYTLPGYGSKLYMIANKDGSSGNSRLRVAHLTLDGNKAHTSETAYIWTILWWYASDSAVEDVQSINSPAHDIEVYGSRNRVVGCRMRDARTGGLRVTDGSSCTVTDNVVENCGTHGISLSMLSGSVCNNNVSTGNEFGISVYECASCTVSGNAISLSGYDGIYMYKCVECQVTGNNIATSGQITNPDWGGSGIRVFWESSRNNIQHNTMRRGSLSMKPAYGIWIQSADCDRNLVTNNDLYLSGTTTSLKNDGTNTVTTAGNRT